MNKTFEKIQNGLKKLSYSKSASIISGIVCAIPFVFEKTFLLSFIMYIPLFYLFVSGEKSRKIYTRVFLYAFGYYACSYSFLCELYPLDFAGFTPLEAVGVIAFALTAIPFIHGTLFTLSFVFCRKMTMGSGSVIKLAAFPCIVMFTEYL